MKKFNKIIVGSGSGGSVLASRLSENEDCEVLLLEAGPDFPEFDSTPNEIKYGYGIDENLWARTFGENSKFSWNYIGRASKETDDMLIPRGRVIGGSSSVNAQIFLRGLPEDFDDWAKMGNDRWNATQTMPFFQKIENDLDFSGDFHNSEGPISVRRWDKSEWEKVQLAFYKASLSIGQPNSDDANDPNSTGVGPMPFNNPDGIRWSTNFGYLSKVRHRMNLTIKANCLVRKIIFEGTKAIGVEIESPAPLTYKKSTSEFPPKIQPKIYEIFCDEVILCAGAIETPHILMLSGIGSQDKLKPHGIEVINDLPGVGENLRDHPQIQVFWKTNKNLVQNTLSTRIQVGIRYTASGSKLRNDMFMHPVGHAPESGIYLDSSSGSNGFGIVCALYLAMGSGNINLKSSNPQIQPDLNYNFMNDEFDLKRMREATRMAVRMGESKHLKDEIVTELITPNRKILNNDDLLNNWITKISRTSHHVSGTCKMGPIEDNMSVVDQDGKIHNLENIRIADASIMPDCIRANTNATTIVIGERVSDSIISEDLRNS
jgi:choline dehydrogenase